MSEPILIISGPTASGKTDLAAKLAKLLDGELVSADSRQIYRGLDIGTGKDRPENVKIHLIDLINPNQSFSVAQYRELALKTIKEIKSRGKLPIVVGGTGQYLEAIINPPKPSFNIKPNKFLRFFLNKFSLKTLQVIYKFLDEESFSKLNYADLHNPHRLIRKIEIKLSHPRKIENCELKVENYYHLSLTAPNRVLYQRVDQRVEARIKNGLEQEIKKLLKKYRWSDPGLNTHAYKELKTGFTEENINRWRFDEHRYVRRQKTWLEKMPNIRYFDITSPHYPQEVIDYVLKCYNKL